MNSQKLIFAVYAFFIFPLTMLCQSFSVSGFVKNESDQPISYANIFVLKVEDSTTVSGTTSNELGKFQINNLDKGNYLIKVSFMGLKNSSKTINLASNIDFGNIILKEEAQALSEVELLTKKPTLKRENDRLIFNVESTSLTEGSIWSILRSTPGILMINDEISIRNASNIIYLINDKRIYLSGGELQQLLSGTTANAVQAIEVITYPPAKYDAEGGAVINIKMSKTLVAGYNGSVFGNYTQGIYPRVSAGTNHFFKGKKTSLYLGYTFNSEKQNRINDERIVFIQGDQPVGNWQTDVDRNTALKSHTLNMNFDYNINDKNTLSVSANGLMTPYWKRDTKSFTHAVDSTFRALNDTEDDILNIGANLDYVYKSENGTKVSFNAHHTNYDYDRFQDVGTNYLDTSNQLIRTNNFNTTSIQDIKIYSGQIDLSFPLNQNGVFEVGIKTANIDSNSNIEQIITNDNTVVSDSENSGIFNYDETNHAAYVSLNKEWENWSLTAGVRTEYTDGLGVLDSGTKDEENDFDYFKTFPTASVTHSFNDSHSLGLSYTKRIERPTYSNLNPFKFFFNDNAFFGGNPNLQPAITQLLTLSYSINDTYTFEIYYRDEDATFSELSFQDNDLNQIFYRPSNLRKEVDYGFDFILYKSFTKHWTAYLVTSIFNDKAEFFAEQNDNVIQTNERWSYYGNAINYFTFLKDQSLTANLSLLYISPVVDGSSQVSTRTQVDIGIKKSFNQGKWILSLSANDIFLGSDFTVKNNYLDQNNQYYARLDNRWVRMGLRYNFGNTKLSTNENIKDFEERDRLNKSN